MPWRPLDKSLDLNLGGRIQGNQQRLGEQGEPIKTSPVRFHHGPLARAISRDMNRLFADMTEDGFAFRIVRLEDGTLARLVIQNGVQRLEAISSEEAVGIIAIPDVVLTLEHGMLGYDNAVRIGSALSAYASGTGTSLGTGEDQWEGHIWQQSEAPTINGWPDWTGPPEIASARYPTEKPDAEKLQAYWVDVSRDPGLHTGLMRLLAQVWGWRQDINELVTGGVSAGAFGVVRWIDGLAEVPTVRYALINCASGVRYWPLTLREDAAAGLAEYHAILSDPAKQAEHDEQTLRLIESAYMVAFEVADDVESTELIDASTYQAVVEHRALCFRWAWSPQQWETGSQDAMRAVMVGCDLDHDHTGNRSTTEIYDLAITANGPTLSATVAGRGASEWVYPWREAGIWIRHDGLGPTIYAPMVGYLMGGEGEATASPLFAWIDKHNTDQIVQQLPYTGGVEVSSGTTSDPWGCPVSAGRGPTVTVTDHTRYPDPLGFDVAGTQYGFEAMSTHDREETIYETTVAPHWTDWYDENLDNPAHRSNIAWGDTYGPAAGFKCPDKYPNYPRRLSGYHDRVMNEEFLNLWHAAESEIPPDNATWDYRRTGDIGSRREEGFRFSYNRYDYDGLSQSRGAALVITGPDSVVCSAWMKRTSEGSWQHSIYNFEWYYRITAQQRVKILYERVNKKTNEKQGGFETGWHVGEEFAVEAGSARKQYVWADDEITSGSGYEETAVVSAAHVDGDVVSLSGDYVGWSNYWDVLLDREPWQNPLRNIVSSYTGDYLVGDEHDGWGDVITSGGYSTDERDVRGSGAA